MRKDITGIILCGGNSSRMQTNKALLRLNDLPVIEIITNKLRTVFDELIISANEISDYAFLNLHVVKDEFIQRGPLAGIHATLKSSGTEKNFIISCDMPLISPELINYLLDVNSEKEIVLPSVNGKAQQLCGIYSKSVYSEIEKIFTLSKTDKNIKGSVYDLIERVSAELVEVEDLSFYNENIFMNMNSPEDYENIKNIFEKN